MNIDPSGHHRKSLRLKGFDYSQAGGYYITIVTQGRECLFGDIQNDEMVLNDAGIMVTRWWNELPGKFQSTTVEASIVMPNHFHGIIFIHETTVGADLHVGPGVPENHDEIENGTHIGAPLQSACIEKGEHVGSPLRDYVDGTPRPSAPLSQIVQWFKTMTTNEYIRGVKHSNWQPFIGKLWQRNYYEHVIRDEQDYERIFNYIANNPSNWAEDEENK